MLNNPIPFDEVERIAALHATQLLDTAPEEMFDRITRLAARVFRVPTALISLVDTERQWFKSRYGMEACHTSRSISFCGHALVSEVPLVVLDALADARFSDNPLVVQAPFIRFYAGCPIHSIERKKIGTLCVIDYEPRSFNADDVEALQDLACSVEELIHKRQLAMSASQLLALLREREEASALSSARRTELERLLNRDVLTGLPDHALFKARLSDATMRWCGKGQQGLVAYIDLDHFKNLNGALGHHLMDEVRIALAKRLTEQLQPRDVLAREGADQFLLMVDRPDQDQFHGIIEMFSACIGQPLGVGEQEIALTSIIGYACYPQDGQDAGALIHAAKAAMHQVKQAGRATTARYSPKLSKDASQRATLESQLRRAVKQDELVLHYQPKVDLRTGRVTGVEALVRWQHPDMGMVPPAKFIPLAEETGLIAPLGEWVLHTACKQGQEWKAGRLGIVPIAVNLSSRQFLHNDIVSTVESAMRGGGLGPGELELELTESVSMGNPGKSSALMFRLKEMGISIAIDDFGTGYSSLSYLKRLPIDKIKIDRSFVIDMTENAEALAIVQAIIAMAHRLNLKVVAEGVETEKQLSFLTLNLCDEIQGYLFSRPLGVTDCTELLASGRRLTVNEHSGRAIAALFGCR
jgi:diguanylate cyclase (GGDEF)-like protein